ncbi:MAG: hypothetical protein M1829_000128 [Trizodia sp. TS-e1964]|nr:MAG: hypothetical protein M1829_000128 [Trizodia sp. TS-e1964]
MRHFALLVTLLLALLFTQGLAVPSPVPDDAAPDTDADVCASLETCMRTQMRDSNTDCKDLLSKCRRQERATEFKKLQSENLAMRRR